MPRVTFILETMHSMDTDQIETDVPIKILSREENRNVSWRLMADVGCSAQGKDLQGTQLAAVQQHGVGGGYCRKIKTDFTTLCEIRRQTRASIRFLTNTYLGAKTGKMDGSYIQQIAA